MIHLFRVRGLAAATALVLIASGTAWAQTVTFRAELKGSNEVPPNDSKGTGAVVVTYNPAAKEMSWKGTVSGMSGPATAAHFHGPAEPSKNAGIVVPIPGAAAGAFEGKTTLTEAQAAELLAGHWYVNIHTQAHPPGELRGQVVR
jgi:hypothetical protein